MYHLIICILCIWWDWVAIRYLSLLLFVWCCCCCLTLTTPTLPMSEMATCYATIATNGRTNATRHILHHCHIKTSNNKRTFTWLPIEKHIVALDLTHSLISFFLSLFVSLALALCLCFVSLVFSCFVVVLFCFVAFFSLHFLLFFFGPNTHRTRVFLVHNNARLKSVFLLPSSRTVGTSCNNINVYIYISPTLWIISSHQVIVWSSRQSYYYMIA